MPAAGQAQDAVSATIEEVIVTAQKREQSLGDVPISISVLDGATIERESIHNFEEIDERVPNFFVARSPGADAIFMRGLGSGSGSPTLEQSVVMFVDEIYGGNARQFQTPWLDLERVEVLRGPQGYLVGKNTSAGAIRFISRRPGDAFEGSLSGEYDFEREGATLTAVLSGPVSDTIGLRGAVKYRDVDGYIYNSLTGQDEPGNEEFAARLIGTWESGPWSVMAKAEATTLKNAGNPYVMTSAIAGRPLDRTKETLSAVGPDRDDNETQNFALQVDYELGEHTLTSITGYSAYESVHEADADFFETDLAWTRFHEDFDQLSQEFRLLSPTGNQLEYILGLYAHTTDLDERRVTVAFFAPPASSYRTFVQEADTISAYGGLTWHFNDRWSVLGGLRYTHESKDASYVRIMGADSWPGLTGAVVADITDSLSQDEVSPAVTLQWRPTDEVMMYATYSEGHKAGGFQGAIPNATATAFEYGPEKAQSMEIGAKGGYARGSFELAVFETSYEDLQVSASVPVDPNTTVFGFFTGNAAEATTRGMELSGVYAVTDSFRLRGSFALLDGKFDSYQDGPCAQGQTPDDPVRGSCVLTGVDLPFAPQFSGSLSAAYETPLTDRLTFIGDLTVNFRDDYRTDAPNDPYFVQDGYEKIDLRLALMLDDSLEVALIGRNLTDEYTFGFGGSGSLAANPVFGLAPDSRMLPLDPPRTVALQVNWTF